MGSKIYVGGLPYSATEQQLSDLFGAHGTVASAKIIADKFTGQSRGFGFVEMGNDQEAQAAINALNGSAASANSAIAVSPLVDFPIDGQFAFILSSPTACTLTNPSTSDQYNAGDAYDNSGAGGAWVPLINTADAKYDVPSFITLIQPAIDVAYTQNFHANVHTATLLNNGKVLLAGTGNVGDLYDPATNAATSSTATAPARASRCGANHASHPARGARARRGCSAAHTSAPYSGPRGGIACASTAASVRFNWPSVAWHAAQVSTWASIAARTAARSRSRQSGTRSMATFSPLPSGSPTTHSSFTRSGSR